MILGRPIIMLGRKSVTVSMHGAPLSYVSWSGQEPLQLNSSGDGNNIIISEGKHTIVNTIPLDGSDLVIWSAEVNITGDTTDVYLVPEGAIYWYGREVLCGKLTLSKTSGDNYGTPWSSVWSGGQVYMTEMTNYIQGSATSQWNGNKCVTWGTNVAIPGMGSYDILKARMTIDFDGSGEFHNTFYAKTSKTFTGTPNAKFSENKGGTEYSDPTEDIIITNSLGSLIGNNNCYVYGLAGVKLQYSSQAGSKVDPFRLFALWMEHAPAPES